MANEINRIPAVLTDYAIYLGNARLLGTGEITMPTLTQMVTEMMGAGLGGKIDVPVIGKFDSMVLGIAWRTIEQAAVQLIAPVPQQLVLRALQQNFDSALSQVTTDSVVIYVTGLFKSFDLGKLVPGDPEDGKLEMEVLRLRIVQSGTELCVIDKLNYIYTVLGVDYSAVVRSALGIGPGFGSLAGASGSIAGAAASAAVGSVPGLASLPSLPGL